MAIIINLNEFQSIVADGGYAGTKELTDATVLLCLSFLLNAQLEEHWVGAFQELTSFEIDEIDEIVANAKAELM